jgi:hypothetical protein
MVQPLRLTVLEKKVSVRKTPIQPDFLGYHNHNGNCSNDFGMELIYCDASCYL